MCRGLVGVVGRRIVAATLPRSRVRPLRVRPAGAVLLRRLAGRLIAGVHRRGKRVVIEVAEVGGRPREWLVIEPRMTGQMLVVDPPTEEHVRLVVQLAEGPVPRFLFWDRRGLGTIRLLDDRGLELACGRSKLGPDGLVVTGDDLATRLGRSRRAVKAALLDRTVAGIGNIYASEVLHRVAIHPRTSCRRIRREHWERIAAATRRVLTEAVALEGSSIGDETYRTADSRPGRAETSSRLRPGGQTLPPLPHPHRTHRARPTCHVLLPRLPSEIGEISESKSLTKGGRCSGAAIGPPGGDRANRAA